MSSKNYRIILAIVLIIIAVGAIGYEYDQYLNQQNQLQQTISILNNQYDLYDSNYTYVMLAATDTYTLAKVGYENFTEGNVTVTYYKGNFYLESGPLCSSLSWSECGEFVLIILTYEWYIFGQCRADVPNSCYNPSQFYPAYDIPQSVYIFHATHVGPFTWIRTVTTAVGVNTTTMTGALYPPGVTQTTTERWYLWATSTITSTYAQQSGSWDDLALVVTACFVVVIAAIRFRKSAEKNSS
jgi:hypothetical protein